ncbi:vesicle-associated membrane protein 4-like [Centruroides vittatus]|uniref:vesicle-associated membrane protein 4-like n=1 Tax=Centruroides vittatus TaxID=120091 RepID=UPI00350F135E
MPPKFVRNLSDDDLLNATDTEKEKLLKDSDDDEDFFLRGPSTSAKSLKVANDKDIRRVQFQVDEVSSIMQENIGRIVDRGEKLEDLEDKSDLLSSNADYFRNSARRMQRKMWWQNMKLKIIIGLIIVAILLIIIIPIIIKNR